MMVCLTKEDKEMLKEMKKWEYFNKETGVFELREDAPKKFKDFRKKMVSLFSMFQY